MGARRTEMHRLLEVVRLHRRGHSARRIARLLRMGRDTIRAYRVALEAGGLLDGGRDELPELEVLRACVESQSPSKPAPPQQTSTLERWVEQILELHESAGPTAIHNHLRLNQPGHPR